ncbi:MFS transporter [Simkania negevensis]|uniref:MFS transporter n=1 Tax=Simkania negevensis TaxID=83561 RepID=A0ABS3APC6_9BACT|nr:MFS transporter [Simkania negevensis]
MSSRAVSRAVVAPGFVSAMVIGWLGHFVVDFFIGIWPIYKTMADLDIAKAGLIAGFAGFFGDGLQIVFGIFSDRGFVRRLLFAGVLLSFGIVFVTYTHNYYMMFFLVLLLYIGSGVFHPAGAGMMGSLTAKHKSVMSTFFTSGGMLGLAISQIVFAKTYSFFNGHAFLLVLPALFLLVCILFAKLPDHVQQRQKGRFNYQDLFKAIKFCRKPLMLLYFLQILCQALFFSTVFLLPDVLQSRGYPDWLVFGGGHLFLILGAALLMIPAGYIADRCGERFMLLWMVFFGAISYFFFLWKDLTSLAAVCSLLFCVGACLGTINPVIVAFGNRLMPRYAGAVSALLMGFAWCFSYFGPALSGYLTSLFPTNGPVKALTIMGSLYIVSFVLSWMLPNLKALAAFTPQPAPSDALEKIKI